MKRIYDFSSFSKIYEADTATAGGEKKVSDFQNLIQMTLANILDCYKRQTALTKDPYDAKIMADYDSAINGPGVDSLKKMLDKVQSALNTGNEPAKKAGEAWKKAADAFIGVLSKIYELMPNNKEGINKIVGDFMKSAKAKLAEASKDNEAKKAAEEAEKKAKADNNSLEYSEGEEIFEALDFLKGKKGKLKDISKQITIVDSTLNDLQGIDFLKDEAAKQRSELDKISFEVVKMFGRKNKDIENDDLERIATQMSEIVSKLADKQKELASQNETTKEAALLFAKATQDFANATKLDSDYQAAKAAEKAASDKADKDKKAASDKADKDKKDEEFEKKKKDIGFSKKIKAEDVKDKRNDTVAEVQRLIKNKLEKKIKKEDSPEFDKFANGKYAGDGYFGENSEKVIKAVKAGLGITNDDSSDITEDLIDKLLSLKESRSFEYGRFKSFRTFESLNEGRQEDVKFDFDKFLGSLEGKEVKKVEINVEDTLKRVKEAQEKSKKIYDEISAYITGKDFTPTNKGKDIFKDVMEISWDDFKKLDSEKQKTILKTFMDKMVIQGGIKLEDFTKDAVDKLLKVKS